MEKGGEGRGGEEGEGEEGQTVRHTLIPPSRLTHGGRSAQSPAHQLFGVAESI